MCVEGGLETVDLLRQDESSGKEGLTEVPGAAKTENLGVRFSSTNMDTIKYQYLFTFCVTFLYARY